VSEGIKALAELYRCQTYDDLGHRLARLASDALGLESEPRGLRMALTATAYDRAYYEEHRASGLDYLGHRAWQREYALWLKGALGLPDGASVLDVGCAAGSIAAGFAAAGLACDGVDLNNHLIPLGRRAFPAVRSLNVSDAANLHLFGDKSFDLVHVAQTA